MASTLASTTGLFYPAILRSIAKAIRTVNTLGKTLWHLHL
jgi:hypothetical protein